MADTTQTPEQLAAAETAKTAALEADKKAITTNAPGIDKLLGHALKPESRSKPAKTEEELAADAEKKEKADAAKAEAKRKKDEAAAKAKEAEARNKPAPVVDPEKIAEATGRGVVKALDEREAAKKEKEKPATEQDPYPYLDSEEKEDLPILAHMEKMFPDKYKGLKDKYTASIKAIQDYREGWEKANAGKEWDAEAEEHNEFFSKNDVDWNDRDYNKAIAAMTADEVRAEANKQRTADQEKLTAKEKAERFAPLAAGEGVAKAVDLFKALGDEEWAKVRDLNGAVNTELLKKLNEDDQKKTTMILTAATQLENLAAENFRLFNGVVPFDANNQSHATLANFALKQEADMLQLPPQDRVDSQQRTFVTSKEFYAMKKDEQKHHWTFSMTDLNTLLAADIATNLKKQLEAEEIYAVRLAEKRGYKRVKEDGTVEEPEPVKKPVTAREEAAEEEVFKPRQVGSVTDAAVAQMRGKKLIGGNKATSDFIAGF